jgi:hypothetical protein
MGFIAKLIKDDFEGQRCLTRIIKNSDFDDDAMIGFICNI